MNDGIYGFATGFRRVSRRRRIDVRQVTAAAIERAYFAIILSLLVDIGDPRRDARVGRGRGGPALALAVRDRIAGHGPQIQIKRHCVLDERHRAAIGQGGGLEDLGPRQGQRQAFRGSVGDVQENRVVFPVLPPQEPPNHGPPRVP